MTRENKLALVVGFGLILVVAILISDHFSTVRSKEAADLLPPQDPLLAERHDEPGLIDFRPDGRGQPLRQAAASRDPLVLDPADGDPAPAARVGRMTTHEPIELPNIQELDRTRVPADPLAAPSAASERFHTVSSGENLTQICSRYYGTEALVRPLARANGLSDPDRIRAGHRLRLPPAEILGGASPVPPSTPAPPPPAAAPREPAAASATTYVVAKGDILSELARRFMGSAKRWHELWEANRDVIDDPDRIEVGTVMRIPSRSRR